MSDNRSYEVEGLREFMEELVALAEQHCTEHFHLPGSRTAPRLDRALWEARAWIRNLPAPPLKEGPR